MASNVTRSQQGGAAAAAQAAVAKDVGARRAASSVPERSKPVGYGLPCSKCHLYYAANLDVCPTCKHNERVSPIAPKTVAKPKQAAPDAVPDSTMLEREREEFLRQFKAQMREAHAEAGKGPESVCKCAEHPPGVPVAPEICGACCKRLQERIEVCEAALNIDLKEAAQIVYEAVWADPSDPNKTYENAASALLAELRRRAGLTTT